MKYLYFKEEIYKENLNALIGMPLLNEINFDIEIKEKSVQEILKELASKLKIIDENVIKFIEVSSTFNNIVDFVYEVINLMQIWKIVNQLDFRF